MQSASVLPQSFPRSALSSIPQTFQQALRQGWKVASDNSQQSINEKRRDGTVVLKKPGCAALIVDYVGTPRGFRFSVPRLSSE